MPRQQTLYACLCLAVMLVCSVHGYAQKTIKNAHEYTVYITALNTPDPAAKAAAMEEFLRTFPASVVKEDALEQAMLAYQEVGDMSKVQTTAQRLLDLDPNHIRALAITVYLKRNAAVQEPKLTPDVASMAERGINGLPLWQKPTEMPDAEFAKLKTQMSSIFNGAAGFAALQTKDYARARQYFARAIAADPTSLQDDYQYAIAELEGAPLEANGFWYLAKAISLSKAANNAAAASGIDAYGRAKYKNYHGTDAGWDGIVTASAAQAGPPSGFSITKKKTPAEMAVDAAAEYALADLSISDREFILSYRDASQANKAAAEKVWRSMQDLQKNGTAALELPVKVITASRASITAAIDSDDQKTKADIEITFAVPVATPPAVGSEIKVIGFLTDYRPEPFMFVMTKARIGQ